MYQIDSEVIEVLNEESVRALGGQFQIENQDNQDSIVLKLPDCNLVIDTSLQLVRLFLSMEVINTCSILCWEPKQQKKKKNRQQNQKNRNQWFNHWQKQFVFVSLCTSSNILNRQGPGKLEVSQVSVTASHGFLQLGPLLYGIFDFLLFIYVSWTHFGFLISQVMSLEHHQM